MYLQFSLSTWATRFPHQPATRSGLNMSPTLGLGYDCDYCNADVILTRMSVENGRIVLPDGMSYHMLVLPDRDAMPVELPQKIKELVAAGATVLGPKPLRDPGLRNYPQCDARVQMLANEIWGDCDGENILEIDVTNLWANRLVGDWKLPEAERFTKTNVWHLYKDKTLI
ncbi:MAG: hypothetical protein GY790_09235 [Bacteroidetes bacterium]|nr:hypothetical protein [Bacteroidota bacterium]